MFHRAPESDRQVQRLWDLFEAAARVEFAIKEGYCPDEEVRRQAQIHLDEAFRLIKQGLLNRDLTSRSRTRIVTEIEDELLAAYEEIWHEQGEGPL